MPEHSLGHHQSQKSFEWRIMVAASLSLLFWACAFSGSRPALTGYTPAHLALLRLLIASVVLLAFAKPMHLRRVDVRDLRAFLFLEGIGFTAYSYALNCGEMRITAGGASILVNTVPILTALLSSMCFGERLGQGGWLGLLVGFTGAATIAVTNARDFSVKLISFTCSSRGAVPGAVLYRAKTASQALSSLRSHLLFRLGRHAPQLSVSAGLTRRYPHGASKSNSRRCFPRPLFKCPGLRCLGFGAPRMPAARATSLLYAVPVLGVGVGWLSLGEIPTSGTILGGGLACVGVLLVRLSKADQR